MGVRGLGASQKSQLPDGLVALVTGATSGLGLVTAQSLAGRGVEVVLAGRDPARLEEARRSVAVAATGPEPASVLLDLADLTAVASAAEMLGARWARLDLLVANAGVMALPPQLSAQGHELQFATNHLGHFALIGRLLPLLLAAPAARVVTVTSIAARRAEVDLEDLDCEVGYDPWVAYGRSKRANLLFALELHRRARRAQVALASLAAHPGIAATALFTNGPGRFASLPARAFYRFVATAAPSARSGARSQLLAATDLGTRSGSLVGPLGPGQLFGPPGAVRLPLGAGRPEPAGGLWESSERLTGVRFKWD